jgi:hypothetical protein
MNIIRIGASATANILFRRVEATNEHVGFLENVMRLAHPSLFSSVTTKLKTANKYIDEAERIRIVTKNAGADQITKKIAGLKPKNAAQIKQLNSTVEKDTKVLGTLDAKKATVKQVLTEAKAATTGDQAGALYKNTLAKIHRLPITPVEKQALIDIMEGSEKSLLGLKKAADEVLAKIAELPSDASIRKELNRHLKGQVGKKYGNAAEDVAVQRLEKYANCKIVDRNAGFKSTLGNISGRDVLVHGKVDGISMIDGLQKIVEFKSKTKALNPQIPWYNLIQLQAYLHMSGIQNGTLVEYLQRDEKLSALGITNVTYDEHFWTAIIAPNVYNFCHAIHHLLSSEQILTDFLVAANAQKIAQVETLMQQMGSKSLPDRKNEVLARIQYLRTEKKIQEGILLNCE